MGTAGLANTARSDNPRLGNVRGEGLDTITSNRDGPVGLSVLGLESAGIPDQSIYFLNASHGLVR